MEILKSRGGQQSWPLSKSGASYKSIHKGLRGFTSSSGHEACWHFMILSFLIVEVKVKSLSHVWLFATPWTVAYQAPLSMGFSRQEYWSGVPSPSPPFVSMCNKRYISKPENKENGSVSGKTDSSMSFFLVLHFSGWIPIWSVGACQAC